MIELLAPAGDINRLKTAFHYGADAVYLGGSSFSLRAFAPNFDNDSMKNAVSYAHTIGKKVYITLNIFPKDKDFGRIAEYLRFLNALKVDGVLITDCGVIDLCKSITPELEIHLSTQANTTNGRTARFWSKQGVKRIVLARELSLDDIKEIREQTPSETELECFVHGAMCISYSGRCLLSNYLSSRNSNLGECVQACRWEYALREVNREGELTICEDDKGTYILNSKDLCMLEYLPLLAKAGISSFKIEGRMKTEYYVANVVNAYRRAIDEYQQKGEAPSASLIQELSKVSHRGYTTGFYLGERDTVSLSSSLSESSYQFTAKVLGYDEEKKAILVEQRNRFQVGDELEILSPDAHFLDTIKVKDIINSIGESVSEAKLVQEVVGIPSDKKLKEFDILRLKRL